jgi:toxin ParE1/3/4
MIATLDRGFGARQSRLYRDTLVQAVGELTHGPDAAGSKVRNSWQAFVRSILPDEAVVEVIS